MTYFLEMKAVFSRWLKTQPVEKVTKRGGFFAL